MRPRPQFIAEVTFHFKSGASDRTRPFAFGENLNRYVPMLMEGIEGLNTIGMWINSASEFHAGDSVRVECVVISPEIFNHVVKRGVRFELWDGNYFASGTVLERVESGWPRDS